MTLPPCVEAKPVVVTAAPWAEVLSWLQQNVGNLLWSQPIMAWHGEGWHMKSHPEVAPRGQSNRIRYQVTFDDPKLAVIFALKWA